MFVSSEKQLRALALEMGTAQDDSVMINMIKVVRQGMLVMRLT